MSYRQVSFAPGEWYHCFTRGVDRRKIYMDMQDYQRFQMLLYTCNSKSPIHLSNMSSKHQGPAMPMVLRHARGETIVDIVAYCLMPNHLHLLLREKDDGGISAFMQKLGTAYTMYFNKKYTRTGALFSGRFKAVRAGRDVHFRRLFNYIHANPAELYESDWKKGVVKNPALLEKKVRSYVFSSLPDYEGEDRPQNVIVNTAVATQSLETVPSFETILNDATSFSGIDGWVD